jgi:hypothetical protein
VLPAAAGAAMAAAAGVAVAAALVVGQEEAAGHAS